MKRVNGLLGRVGMRFVAVVFAAVLAVSTLAASPLYSVSAYVAADELSYNSGHRDEASTALSEQAIAYYSGNYTYSKLMNRSGEKLKSSLEKLMTDTATGWVSYKNLTKYWVYTDAEDGIAGTVLFYSDELPIEKTIISREHVWPKSHASFKESGGGADLHHLRPTDSIVNSQRGNFVIGEVTDVSTSYKEIKYNGKVVGYYDAQLNLFEPLDNVKGDIARILLYVFVRWDEPNLYTDDASKQVEGDENDGQRVIESLETLLQWIIDDPVDTWEMSRNDLVEQVQGNRNVFIDYPELAWKLFDEEVPEELTPAAAKNSKTFSKAGATWKITVENLPSDCTVKFSSLDKSVAKVSSKGKVTAVSSGQTKIKITVNKYGKKYVSYVTIKVK